MILIIDNYDSFTYNLYQYIGEIYSDVRVIRNDKITIDEIEALNPSAIVISPGPGFPNSAGISIDAIIHFANKTPILGVCLGHQAIGEAFGGTVLHAKQLVHGKVSTIDINPSSTLFKGLPSQLNVARYHSLVVDSKSLPACFNLDATTTDGEIMAISHKEYDVYGVQFHPESVMTKYGKKIIRNFICNIAHLEAENDDTTQIAASERNVLKNYLKKVIEGDDLTQNEAEDAMDAIMSGEATDAQIGSFLTALRMKGETIDEITGFARVMRNKANTVKHNQSVIDIVGTGGDLSGSFNISTTTTFVAVGAGLNVAKHGNRSVSSRSGSADVLEALGVNIQMSPRKAIECLEKLGLCFMFAPKFHQSMKFAATPRREIGVRSVFNILGPLSNPASAQYILLGVYDESLTEVMAKVLMNLGITSASIVYGTDGLDEVTITGATKICEVRDGKLIKCDISPEQYGIQPAQMSDLIGGNATENAQITLDVLNGKKGAKRDIVVLNTAVALYTAHKAQSIEEGIVMAQESIDSGCALKKLNELIALTNSL